MKMMVIYENYIQEGEEVFFIVNNINKDHQDDDDLI